MNEIALREAAIGDAPTVAAIYAHYVEHSVATFDTTPPPVAAWAERIEATATAGLPFLVVESAQEQVVGFETSGRLREVGRKFGEWIDIVMMQRAITRAVGR